MNGLSLEQTKAWQRFVGAEIDGVWGKNTERATRFFQEENGLRADGIIGEMTLLAAREKDFVMPSELSDSGITSVLPPSGIGFTTYSRENDGRDQYGTAKTIAAIIALSKKWFALHPEVPIQFGDISRRGGGAFPPHASHRDGRDVDVRPFRRDGKALPVSAKDALYDAELTEKFVRLVRRELPRAIIYFNCKKLIAKGLTARAAGHDNHLHIRLK